MSAVTTDDRGYAGKASAGTSRALHGTWSSRLAFILAATGSAVGLGNIWKFPYITGEYGGGAFVLVYLACIAVVGIPILMAEVMIGRRGGQSPIATMQRLAQAEGRSRSWMLLGIIAALGSFLILSFYSVVGGWAVSYVVTAATGTFAGRDADGIGALFTGLLGNPLAMLGWHTLFMVMTIAIVARGVRAGLERAVSVLMPMLFGLLVLLVGYSLTTGKFAERFAFLFNADFSRLSTEGVLAALGHAFFTLSLGVGAMMAYGAYLPREVSIGKTAVTVAGIDTVVALTAGLAIFPIVFANGLEAGAGPGLVFQTLPLAFGQIPFGTVVGTVFFALLVVAALTSAISMLEPTVAWLEEHKGIGRPVAAAGAGAVCWALGILSVLSFNLLSGFTPLGMLAAFDGKTLFDLLDYLTANIMMPLTGLATAIFAGWLMSRTSSRDELGLGESLAYRLWRFVIRYLTPVAVLTIFLYNLT